MVIATVRGDIHDIGKNIVVALLDADGFTLVDLGVNVSPEQVAETVERRAPGRPRALVPAHVRYEALRETIDLVRAESAAWHPHLPIVLGGAAVDAMVSERLGAGRLVRRRRSRTRLRRVAAGLEASAGRHAVPVPTAARQTNGGGPRGPPPSSHSRS